MRVSARTLKTLKRKKLLYVASKKASKTQPTISAE
jgi:ribosomal protein L28